MKASLIIAIGLILSILSLTNRNSKMLTRLMYAYLLIIYTFCNSGNPDLNVYTWTYNNKIYTTSPGFDAMMLICRNIGLPFVVFKGLCGIFILIFYRKSLRLFFSEENTVLALMLIYPFVSSIAQIRNGMMAALILYAICQFIFDPKHRIMPFIIKIALAMLIHPVAFVYLVLLLSKKNFKETKKSKLVVGILLALLVELILIQNPLYDLAKTFISNPKYLSWFDFQHAFEMVTEETLNIKGQLLPVFEQLLGSALVIYMTIKYKEKYLNNNCKTQSNYIVVLQEEQLDIIKNIFLLLLFVLPMYQLTPTYFRIFMNLVPLIYIIGIQLVGDSKQRGTIPKSFVYLALIVYAVILAYFSTLGYRISMLNSFSIS